MPFSVAPWHLNDPNKNPQFPPDSIQEDANVRTSIFQHSCCRRWGGSKSWAPPDQHLFEKEIIRYDTLACQERNMKSTRIKLPSKIFRWHCSSSMAQAEPSKKADRQKLPKRTGATGSSHCKSNQRLNCWIIKTSRLLILLILHSNQKKTT